jgi:hypothetical protein
MNSRMLVDREWKVKNASEFRELVTQHRSVVALEYTDTTSSAGDWGGFIIQKFGNKHYVIPFWQENNWPHRGFTVGTNKPVISYNGVLDVDEVSRLFCEVVYNIEE